jgi:hypothetical protein
VYSYIMKGRRETRRGERNEHFQCEFCCGRFIRIGSAALMQVE